MPVMLFGIISVIISVFQSKLNLLYEEKSVYLNKKATAVKYKVI